MQTVESMVVWSSYGTIMSPVVDDASQPLGHDQLCVCLVLWRCWWDDRKKIHIWSTRTLLLKILLQNKWSKKT